MSEETLLRGKFRPVLGALTPIEPKLLKSVKFKSPPASSENWLLDVAGACQFGFLSTISASKGPASFKLPMSKSKKIRIRKQTQVIVRVEHVIRGRRVGIQIRNV